MSLFLNPIDNVTSLNDTPKIRFTKGQLDGMIPPDYKFNQDFTIEEINDIINYRPSVPFNSYLYYRNLTDLQLLQLEPLFNQLKYNVDPYDIFFYYTRGYMPLDPNIEQQINKCKKYQLAPEPIQDLINKLYQVESIKDYADSAEHPLENVIYAFSENFQDTDMVETISNRYGFGNDSDAVEFYSLLNQYIEKYSDRMDNPMYPGVDLETILSFSLIEYEKHGYRFGRYENRLSITI